MTQQEERIQEALLILPTLYLMDKNGGEITTAQLQTHLREIFKPKGKDAEILAGRNDDKFSQKVRNIKSHSTLERLGVANFTEGRFVINNKGRQYIADNKKALEYLLGFETETMIEGLKTVGNKSEKLIVIDETEGREVVNEGSKEEASSSSYARSRKLREYAVKYFSKAGALHCTCCGFDFGQVYGELGEGMIEIHHIKPVFQYERDDMEKSMAEAVKNLAPVCSNCHRVIHRNRMNPVGIDQLISVIKQNG